MSDENKSKQGCLLCAWGNDLPPDEYCRACGLVNTWHSLRGLWWKWKPEFEPDDL